MIMKLKNERENFLFGLLTAWFSLKPRNVVVFDHRVMVLIFTVTVDDIM